MTTEIVRDDTTSVPIQLTFTDARPANEKRTRQYLTSWRFSCSFGVQELGDEFADRVGQLRHDLSVAYGDRLVGKAIIVDHYHLYLNQRSMESANSWGTAMVGVFAIGMGAGAKTTAPACTHDKMEQGWFDPSELTTPWSPFIVELDVSVDGQKHHVHSVYSPPKNMPAPGILTKFDVAAESTAVHAAVDKANNAVVAELGKQLGSAGVAAKTDQASPSTPSAVSADSPSAPPAAPPASAPISTPAAATAPATTSTPTGTTAPVPSSSAVPVS